MIATQLTSLSDYLRKEDLMVMIKMSMTRESLEKVNVEVPRLSGEKLPGEMTETRTVMGKSTPLLVASLTIEIMNPLSQVPTRGRGNKS